MHRQQPCDHCCLAESSISTWTFFKKLTYVSESEILWKINSENKKSIIILLLKLNNQ